jgi:hypothetical protein
MTTERERVSDELLAKASRSRAQLAELTARLSWLVSEVQRESESEDQERDDDIRG